MAYLDMFKQPVSLLTRRKTKELYRSYGSVQGFVLTVISWSIMFSYAIYLFINKEKFDNYDS